MLTVPRVLVLGTPATSTVGIIGTSTFGTSTIGTSTFSTPAPPAPPAPACMFVVFTDIDGTLIDHTTYSIGAASGDLARLVERGVPLILCSSKTRAEVERLQQDLGTSHPFVTENGGAVFVPHGYFTFPLPGALRRAAYDVIELGRPYEGVVNALRRASAGSGVGVVGFNDMSVEEVAADAGLSLAAARLAKLREYRRALPAVAGTRGRPARPGTGDGE